METKYLFRRYNTWWVKVAVPRTLKDSLGYDLRESLQTHDLEKARELRWQAVENLKLKIESAKNPSAKASNQEVSVTEVQSFVPPTDTSDPQYYHKEGGLY